MESQCFDIGKIFRPSSRRVYFDRYFVATDEGHRVRAELRRFRARSRPHPMRRHRPGSSRESARGGRPISTDLAGADDLRRRQRHVGKAEFLDRQQKPLSVRFGRTNQDDRDRRVNRGAPCNASAWAPTMTNSTWCAFSKPQNSLKSGARSKELSPEKFYGCYPLGGRTGAPVRERTVSARLLGKRRH